MPLRVLDGNQTATTLSSVVTGGEHIVAHSVVSLGSTAIANITSAVSGSVVTIPSLERIANSAATDGIADTTLNFIKIGGHQSGSNQTAHIVHVSTGGAMSVDASGSSVTFSQASVTFGAITGSASILNFPSTQTIAGTVTANVGPILVKDWITGSVTSGFLPLGNSSWSAQSGAVLVMGGADDGAVPAHLTSIAGVALDAGIGSLPISGTVTVGNSVTIGSLPAISGTVTVGNSVTIGSLPAISGTVTANSTAQKYFPYSAVTANRSIIGFSSSGGNTFTEWNGVVDAQVINSVTIGSLPAISGTVTVGNSVTISSLPVISGTVTVGNSITIGSLPAISGTVTANAGSGTFNVSNRGATGVATATSITATTSVTLMASNSNRKLLTIYNEGAGNLHVLYGSGTASTTNYSVKLFSGDYLEIDKYTGQVNSIFATAGTARVTEIT